MPANSKAERFQRRLKVKELALKGFSVKEIAQKLNVHPQTIQKDLEWVNQYYLKLALNNRYIAEKQYAYVERMLDELEMVKKELWTLIEEAKDKKRYRIWLDSLKSIVDRIEKEARILGLFSPSKLIINNFIHIDTLKDLMKKMAEIIRDFVPEDKQKYAIERLKYLKFFHFLNKATKLAVLEDENFRNTLYGLTAFCLLLDYLKESGITETMLRGLKNIVNYALEEHLKNKQLQNGNQQDPFIEFFKELSSNLLDLFKHLDEKGKEKLSYILSKLKEKGLLDF